MQEACFRVYNHLANRLCSVDTNRLVGIPAIPVYNIDVGIKELERCHKAGLEGANNSQAPHPDLPFDSSHYEKLGRGKDPGYSRQSAHFDRPRLQQR